jgi:hypothetical protein
MTKPKPKKIRITHKGWCVSIVKGAMTVTKDTVKRHYDLTYPNGGLEHKKGSDYFYVRCEDFYYQFKFEDELFAKLEQINDTEILHQNVDRYLNDKSSEWVHKQ